MFKITKLTAVFFLFFIFSTAFSQNNIDSLKTVFKTGKNDTIRATAGYYLLVNYSSLDKEYAKYLAQIKVLLDKNLKKKHTTAKEEKYWKLAMAQYYNSLCQQAYESNRIEGALPLMDKAIQLYGEANDLVQMSNAIVNKGLVLRKLRRISEAVENYYKALKYMERIGDKAGIAFVQMSIAKVYDDQQKIKEAIVLNKKALTYFKSVKKPNNQDIITLIELRQRIGRLYFSDKQYEVAEQYYTEALEQATQINSTAQMSASLDKIARIHYMRGETAMAYQMMKRALGLEQNDLFKSNIYISLGEFCIAEKKYAEAEQWLNKAMVMGKQEKSLDRQFNAAKYLSQLYRETKKFDKALTMFELYKSLQDSIKEGDSRNAMQEQELKYEFEKKELKQKIIQGKKVAAIKLDAEKKTASKNNWLIALSGILLLLLLGVYFYYRNNRQKQSIAVLEKNQIKQKLLITQMNPHFIFNSIENIQGLIYDKQDDAAVNYLNKFSALTRQILENSNENYISLSEEVDMIKNYLAIQQLLYNNKFDFHISVEETIDKDTIFLPPMLTQPFIENAIKHGLSNKTANGLVDIRFYLKEARLFFEVTDNGKGFDASKKPENHKSLAMTITKERLVNYTKNQDFIVQTDNIIDKDNNITGAKVGFEIPYIYEN